MQLDIQALRKEQILAQIIAERDAQMEQLIARVQQQEREIEQLRQAAPGDTKEPGNEPV